MQNIPVKTTDELILKAQQRQEAVILSQGNTYHNTSTIIIIPTPWRTEKKTSLNCKKCKTKNDYTEVNISGLNPAFCDSYYKHIMKPMNVPCFEMYVPGREVGDAYNTAVEMIVNSEGTKNFKYILTVEHDNLVPFMPNTLGPLQTLYENMDKYDVIGGLYRLKGEPPVPLIYGDPKEKRDNVAGMFKVRWDWKLGDVVECNGMGMGFTLFKLDIFKDKRLTKPYFKTMAEHTDKGPAMYTQDLYFFEKIRALGYRVAVDTRVQLAHMDLNTGQVF